MKYLEIFRLGMRHSYYSNGMSPDFAIAPTSQTQSLLRNHRALAKPSPNGLRIVASATNTGEILIPFAEGSGFRFEMRLANAEFPLFTDLGGFQGVIAPVYTGSESLDLSLRSRTAWNRDYLTVAKPSAKETFVLSQRPVEGLAASDLRLEAGGPVQQVTGYDEEDRLISVDSRNAEPGQAFAVDYRVRPRRARGLFAEVEIEVKSDLVNLKTPAQPAPEYRISFRAKSARWAYYCVTNLANSLAEYSVVDEPPSNGGAALVFGDDWKIDLETNPDPFDRLAQQLAEQYPTFKRYRFMSNDLIDCRQAARKGLKLQLGSNKLPGALANPSIRNFATVRIKIGDSVQEQDCLTEVVKILTDSGV